LHANPPPPLRFKKQSQKALPTGATTDAPEEPTEPLFAFGEAPRGAEEDPTDDFCGNKNEDPSQWEGVKLRSWKDVDITFDDLDKKLLERAEKEWKEVFRKAQQPALLEGISGIFDDVLGFCHCFTRDHLSKPLACTQALSLAKRMRSAGDLLGLPKPTPQAWRLPSSFTSSLDGLFIIDMSAGQWGIAGILIFGSVPLLKICFSMVPFHLQVSASARAQRTLFKSLSSLIARALIHSSLHHKSLHLHNTVRTSCLELGRVLLLSLPCALSAWPLAGALLSPVPPLSLPCSLLLALDLFWWQRQHQKKWCSNQVRIGIAGHTAGKVGSISWCTRH
jgi:hypothetical protein